MSSETIRWVCEELSKLLGTEANEDIASYLLSMDCAHDLEEYLKELLDYSLPECKKFIDKLLDIWKTMHDQNYVVYNKKQQDDSNDNLSSNKTANNKRSKNKPRLSDGRPPLGSPDLNTEGLQDVISPPSGGRSKTKFSPLFGSDGRERTVAKLPGRHMCDCQAHKHALVNNCLKCGRIVCDQEGSGPCLFCGALVCTNGEQEVLSRNTKKSNQLRDRLMKRDDQEKEDAAAEGLEKALKHKNKLLEYDRTSVKRTQVIDDESDYFPTDNKWLNENEKEALKKREDELRSVRFASRKDRKITLDFAGHYGREEGPGVDFYNADDEVVQAVNFTVDQSSEQTSCHGNDYLLNPDSSLMRPKFLLNKDEENWARRGTSTAGKNIPTAEQRSKVVRIQDAELQQMSDDGMALSMHQPWASLLVAGIKKHEGRSWYTAHRGVLWIAAGAKNPTDEEINLVENQYRLLYNDRSLSFPKHYPTGCILGRVEVVDCLAQDDYREQFPAGESESPFVFICDNPRELTVKFPMKGKHKIYKLDSALHKSVKNAISWN